MAKKGTKKATTKKAPAKPPASAEAAQPDPTAEATKATRGKTLEAPDEAAFKPIPAAFKEDLEETGHDTGAVKTAAELEAERVEDLTTAISGPDPKEKETETDAGPIAEYVDEETEPAAQGAGTEEEVDERWEPIVKRAAHLGLQTNTIEQFQTPEELDAFVSTIEVQAGRQAQPPAKQKPAEPADEDTDTDKKTDRKRGQAEAAAHDREEEIGISDSELENAGFYDSETRQFAERLSDVANTALREVKHLRGVLADQAEELGQLRAHVAMQSMDQLIGSELGSDWEPVFGKGPSSSLSPESEYMKARHDLAKGAIGVKLSAADGESMSQAEAIRRSAFGGWPEHLQQLARGKAVEDVSKRRGVMKTRARPTTRKIKPENARASAEAVVAEVLRRKGIKGKDTKAAREEMLSSIGL